MPWMKPTENTARILTRDARNAGAKAPDLGAVQVAEDDTEEITRLMRAGYRQVDGAHAAAGDCGCDDDEGEEN